jgi:hypothetical protein
LRLSVLVPVSLVPVSLETGKKVIDAKSVENRKEREQETKIKKYRSIKIKKVILI